MTSLLTLSVRRDRAASRREPRVRKTSRVVPKYCVVVFFAVCGSSIHAQEPQPDQPRFETSAEVVLVDVSVVGTDGEPVTGLTANDFKLTVNGQPRPVHTVQFISSRGSKAADAAPRLADVSSNDGPSTGRLLLFVIDENYLRIGAGRAVLRTAERVMETLAPGDMVGLARLPTGRGGVEFTTNRERIRRGLSSIMGQQPQRSQFRVRLAEAEAYERRDTTVWDQVIERECGGETASMRDGCILELESDARAHISDVSMRTRVSISAYEQLASRLMAMKAPVNIVLISEGLYVGQQRSDLTNLARLAAAARISFFVVQPDESMFDLDREKAIGTFSQDTMLAGGLEQLAGLTRGSYFKVATGGAGVFERIARELSGYYLLSFEPTATDRTSRDRRIRVEVSRRGLTVRARSTYALADAAAAADARAGLPPEAQVEALLGSPLPSAGLPMRVASYSVTDSVEDETIRVIVSAEIGEAATNAVDWPVGILVFDDDDRVHVDSTRYMTLSPATDRMATPRLLTMTMALKPGVYSLRLASMDHEGNAGSVHHTIEARLNRIAGNVRASDLIISSEVADGGAPRPTPTAIHYSETMYSIIELVSDDAERVAKSRVTVQIAENESSPALVSGDAQPIPRTNNGRAYAALLRLGVLPPGEYVARAIVKVPGEADAQVTRAFRLAPVAAPTDASPSAARDSADDAPAPPPISKIAAPVARFTIDDVLATDVVASFLDYLHREHPVSAASQPMVDQARQGRFIVPTDGKDPPGDEVTLAFIRGLAWLEKKQYAQAAGWFQLSLKRASDFLGAAVYLGAVHAAAGRDNDAIGAWQMATISADADAVYPMLVDALLRTGDAQAALDMIAEAPHAWPSDAAWQRRAATAQAMLGQFGPAHETLTALLQNTPDDTDLLFVAIQVLYRQHLAGPLPTADRAQFDDYTQRYLQAKGADAALVQTWRRYVLR